MNEKEKNFYARKPKKLPCILGMISCIVGILLIFVDYNFIFMGLNFSLSFIVFSLGVVLITYSISIPNSKDDLIKIEAERFVIKPQDKEH